MSVQDGLEETRYLVLVADDDPITRRVLESHLKRWGYDVLTAQDGNQARERLLEHPDIRMMITDWMMPGADGLELCRLARSLERTRYLHVIMLTVKSEKTEIVEAMDAGADAFLTKPVKGSELEAQVRVARRILELDELNWRRIDELRTINRRIERVMESAARVQQSFLPDQVFRTARVCCASIFESSQHLAGDIFNILALDRGRVAAYVLDVSGHGTQAALLSVSIQLLLDSLSERGRRSASGVGEDVALDDPAQVLRMLNRRFPVMKQSGQYFTMIYGVLDPERRTFDYARAGHPWPVWVSASGARMLEDEPSGGSALGIFPDEKTRIQSRTLDLEPGDLVLLYSDGITEARSATRPRDEYSPERLLEVLNRTRGLGAVSVIDTLRADLRAFAGPKAPRDDVTVLAMELVPEPASGS